MTITPAPLHWTSGIHHDGSALYVSNQHPHAGDTVQIRLRTPIHTPLQAVILRTEPDGEQHFQPMHQSEPGLWQTDLTLTMPANPYSFILTTQGEGTCYYNALGVARTQWPRLFDFKLLTDFDAPSWLDDAIFYQIFPDRFANGDPSLDVPEGAFTRYGKYRSRTLPWNAPVRPYEESGNLDFYGGDLPGIVQRLDYLRDLGVTALYLNPIFRSSTNHRYNIEDFFAVDPYLGGDAALAELRAALTERGMRLILDVTPNHSGTGHPWFSAAQADHSAPSAAYYTFYNHPDDYARWSTSSSLAKLNYASPALREVMYRAPDSVLRHWLRPPYGVDGWRLDVFNMIARQGMFQSQAEVAREMRTAVKNVNREAYLLGESFYDATAALQGDQLDAVMNYAGFTLPLWEWLKREAFGAQDFAAQTGRFLAAVPWQIAAMQFNLLDSHDTPRIRHIVGGDTRLVRLAAALLLTFPGVPCIYYGDEIGLDGAGDPFNRAPMPWDEARWDRDLRAYFQRLIALRHESSALRQGGFQLLYAEDGLLAYLRASGEQRLIIVASRDGGDAHFPVWHSGLSDGTLLRDCLSDLTARVEHGHILLRDLPVGAACILQG